MPTWVSSRRGALRFAFARLHSILWITFLGGIATVVGLVFCIIPGVYIWIAFAVAVPVLLTEGVKGTSALGRSRTLVSGRWWGTFGVVLLGTILAGLFLVAQRVRGRAWAGLHRGGGRAPRPVDPARLEREADEAERRGDLERAIRLRFRAGLLRLDRARAIELEASTTSGAVSRKLRSHDFDDVSASFDAVVYGRRPPGGEDVELSRAGWTRVLSAAGGR